jgi:hypothetical protein
MPICLTSSLVNTNYLQQFNFFSLKPGLNGGHPVLAFFHLIGELPAFILAWIDIVGQVSTL